MTKIYYSFKNNMNSINQLKSNKDNLIKRDK